MRSNSRLFTIMLPISFLVGGLDPRDTPSAIAEASAGDGTNTVAMTHKSTTVPVLVASPSSGKTEIDQPNTDAYTRLEQDFRRDYEMKYADSGYAYEQYRPAYRYGYDLGTDPRYHDMDWNSVEQQAHRSWDESTMGLWDQYKEAVHYGWDRGRQS